MLVRCACMWGCILQRESETERGAENKGIDWARKSAKRGSAVPSLSFYRKGSGDRRRQSWHTPASGSTASHSSPLPVGTQTSWCTFRGRMNNSHQRLLHSPETLQRHLKNNAYIVCNGFSTWFHEKQPHAQVASKRVCAEFQGLVIYGYEKHLIFSLVTGLAVWKQQEFSPESCLHLYNSNKTHQRLLL